MVVAFSGLMFEMPLEQEPTSPQGLDLQAVKNLAREEKLKLISFSEKSRVISFRKTVGNVRINVYWTTGTVGTCLNHPQQGKTQLFRRNVDLPTLREIFQNPRAHTGSGYHTKENSRNAANSNSPSFCVGDRVCVRGYVTQFTIVSKRQTSGKYQGKVKVRNDDDQTYYVDYEKLEEVSQIHDDNQCLNLEQEARIQLDHLDNELQKIQNERAKVQEILQDFEQKREMERKRKEVEAEMKRKAQEEEAERQQIAKKKQEEEAQRQALIAAKRYGRGKGIRYCLIEGDHVYKCFDETVTSMACGGNATILFYEGGGWAWTSGLPEQLHNKLNGRQETLPAPTYVAVGSQDRYYVSFADGKSEWVGCDKMTDLLYSTNRTVKTVAFGEDWCTYFVVFEDGWWQWGGTIPPGLSDIINRRKKRRDLECVSLGPNGEYYLEAKNGRAWWGGMTDENLAIASEHCNTIQFMDFCDNNCFFLRY